MKAILFDFIGTTVKEKDSGVITTCFEQAFRDNAVNIETEFLKKQRGKEKKLVIKEALLHLQLPLSLAKSIYSAFETNIENKIDNFSENDGAVDLFAFLLNKKIKIGLGTGLSRKSFEKICNHLRWSNNLFDYTGIANEIGKSRPYPDMIFDMMAKLGIADTKEILKVGDTIADIQEGKNANVRTAVILSGTQGRNELLKQQPDFVIQSLAEIKKIIG